MSNEQLEAALLPDIPLRAHLAVICRAPARLLIRQRYWEGGPCRGAPSAAAVGGLGL